MEALRLETQPVEAQSTQPKCIERMREVLALLRQHGGQEIFARFIHELCHDLRSPIAALSLELYSADFLTGQALEHMDRGESQAARASLDELKDLQSNMSGATQDAEAMLAAFLRVLNES